MPGALVQKKSSSGATGTQPNFNLDDFPILGNTLVAVVGAIIASAGTSPAGSWLNAVEMTNAAGVRTITIGYKLVDAAQAASKAVQPTVQTSGGWNATVMEFSGILWPNPLDKFNSINPAGVVNATLTGDTGVLSQADEVVVAGAVMSGSLTGEAINLGFTPVDIAINDYIIVGYKIVNVTDALNPTLSWTGGTRNRVAGIASFKATPASRLDRRDAGAFSAKTIDRRESGLWVARDLQRRSGGAWS